MLLRSPLRPLLAAFERHSSSARRPIKAIQISVDGQSEQFHCSGGELARKFNLMPRDLRLLATRNINLAVRSDYFLFRFPPFTGIVTHDRVVLIADNGGSDASGAGHSRCFASLAAQVLEGEIKRAVHRPSTSAGDFAGYLYDGLLQFPLPFELRVLDAVLREDLQRKQERFTRISQRMSRALQARAQDVSYSHGLVMLSLAADGQAESRERALYQLITLSDALSALELEVKRAETSLEALLKSDEDMAALYLSHRARRRAARPTDDHSEVELMLEAASTQYADLDDRILGVKSTVQAHRTLEELKLRNERNRIMRLEVLLQMGSLSLAVAAVTGGFFGMNLHSGLEEVPHMFWLVAGMTTSVSALLLSVFTSSVRTFHGKQRLQLVETAALQHALAGLDHAYFALRQNGTLGTAQSAYEGAPGVPLPQTITCDQLNEAMAASGAQLDKHQLQALHHLLAKEQDCLYHGLMSKTDSADMKSMLNPFKKRLRSVPTAGG